jgi:hypothetical protein
VKRACLEFLVRLPHGFSIFLLLPVVRILAEEAHDLAVEQEQGTRWYRKADAGRGAEGKGEEECGVSQAGA